VQASVSPEDAVVAARVDHQLELLAGRLERIGHHDGVLNVDVVIRVAVHKEQFLII
jgi:hypothetical protein